MRASQTLNSCLRCRVPEVAGPGRVLPHAVIMVQRESEGKKGKRRGDGKEKEKTEERNGTREIRSNNWLRNVTTGSTIEFRPREDKINKIGLT
jgi:hypothetical protein